jgi:hypothetical protein
MLHRHKAEPAQWHIQPVPTGSLAHSAGWGEKRERAALANSVVAATMSSGARRCGNDVVG